MTGQEIDIAVLLALDHNGTLPRSNLERVFTARDPRVEGIGFAAIRDAVTFLRDAAADDVGAANPLAGQVSKTIAMGTSQSGNFLRSMTYFGLNQDSPDHVGATGVSATAMDTTRGNFFCAAAAKTGL